MKSTTKLVVLGACLVIPILAIGAQRLHLRPAPYNGHAGWVLDHATRVECYDLIWRSGQPVGRVDGIGYFERTPDKGPDFARNLANVVLNPTTYSKPLLWGAVDREDPTPAYMFRAVAGQEHVDVVVAGSILFVLEHDPKAPICPYGHGYIQGIIASSAGDQVTDLEKAAFPKETNFQPNYQSTR